MPKRERKSKAKSERDQFSLSLKLEPTDRNNPNVDADDFLSAAEKWLHALKTFVKEQGEHVKWEIVDLKRWEEGLRKIEQTGRPAPKFTPEALVALEDFVLSIPKNTVVSLGTAQERRPVTPLTQRQVEQAIGQFPPEPRNEYVAKAVSEDAWPS